MCREWVDVDPASHSMADGIMGRIHTMRGDLGLNPLSGASDMSPLKSAKVLSPNSVGVSSVGRCKSCERKQTCSSCLLDLGCGWCYYVSLFYFCSLTSACSYEVPPLAAKVNLILILTWLTCLQVFLSFKAGFRKWNRRHFFQFHHFW